MRSFLTPAGKRRVHVARLRELISFYDLNGPALLSDGTHAKRNRDSYRVLALTAEVQALARDLE